MKSGGIPALTRLDAQRNQAGGVDYFYGIGSRCPGKAIALWRPSVGSRVGCGDKTPQENRKKPTQRKRSRRAATQLSRATCAANDRVRRRVRAPRPGCDRAPQSQGTPIRVSDAPRPVRPKRPIGSVRRFLSGGRVSRFSMSPLQPQTTTPIPAVIRPAPTSPTIQGPAGSDSTQAVQLACESPLLCEPSTAANMTATKPT
jgi:hypothetical protein